MPIRDEAVTEGVITMEGNARREPWSPDRRKRWALVGQGLCVFIISLDMTILTATLPTVAQAIHANATKSFWIAASYLLANAVCQPLMAALTDVLGHKLVFFSSVVGFTVGSIVCASASTVGVMLVGRTIQGIGGGGIISVNLILLCKHVPPRYQPAYQSYMQSIFALGSNIAPIIGGAFITIDWRWIFYLNLPFCGIALVALPFLLLPDEKPASVWRERLYAVDWVGSILMVLSSTSLLVGMSWGGNEFGWRSAAVLVSIIMGLILLILTITYEQYLGNKAHSASADVVRATPFLRFEIFQHYSGIIAFVCTMLQGYLLFATTYYLVVYLMACKLYSPVLAGVGLLPFASMIVPVSGITGKLITLSDRYRWAVWLGWLLTILGSGLLVVLSVHTATVAWVFIFLCAGAGQGLLFPSHWAAIQPMCRRQDAAHAICMYSFVRSFGLCLGVILGGTAFQNFFRIRLGQLGLPVAIASDVEGFVPMLQHLPLSSPAKGAIQGAYAWALRRLFITSAAVSALGGLLSTFIKHGSMDTSGKTGYTLANLSRETSRARTPRHNSGL